MRHSAPRSLRLLASHVRPHRWTIGCGALLGLLGSVGSLAEPLVAMAVVDALAEGSPLGGLLALLTVLVVGGALITGLGSYVLQRTAESMVAAARERLVSHILMLRVPEVDRLRPGDLLSRTTSDTTLIQSAAGQALVDSGSAVLAVVGSIVLMAWLDPLLLGVCLAVIAVIGVGAAVMLPPIRRASERSQRAVGEVGALMERSLGAFRTVKASGTEHREISSARAAVRRAWRSGVRGAGWMAVTNVTAVLAGQGAFLVVLGVGGARVATGALDVSELIAFLLYLMRLTGPIGQLVQGVGGLQSGLAAMRRIDEVERLPVERDGPVPRKARTGTSAASVSFTDVSFRYHDDAPPVLRDVTLTVPAGGLTALVGPSGAGKTTLFSLIERFYDPSSGTVALDGTDLREMPLAQVRSMIGYVEQDAPIMAGTLRDNLCYAAPDSDEEEVRRVVALTRLTDLVDRLPDGLDTEVGHRGTALSGGERQRVAVARALLRRPRLLLLDEATSQLDAANETALRAVVADVARTTTVMVIAHRLSTVTDADQIVVVDGGRVRAVGSHTALMVSDGLYRELIEAQLLDA
ncbi:ABC transporter ATP-binding protein [Thermobifida halotolerans]|uniref:ABC transporter ATP-binding protein n=1 Tax=Thermobifida halotolerans TaxID=483545 RepID=A0A399G7Y7_9ACTN|nr:ABC transporter ATP-binding protein [Thermobifida halotolerans]UOE20258.1 ABC transporter ATP-binding protein [Thermobifida halotolerans]